MIVARRMTPNPITVKASVPITDAQKIMRKNRVHRLPVVDNHKRLIGIVTEKDILYASPSPASTLDVYEMAYLVSKLTVDKVMTKTPITVSPGAAIEEASRIMVDNDIGGLCVVEDEELVGIITESDLFKVFSELFGARDQGTRVSMLVPDHPGEIFEITKAVFENGGNIISFGTFLGTAPTNALCTMKVTDINKDDLVELIKPYVIEIQDIRES
ncbi:MAG: CBS domain-containing protein [Spirochaetia bacterium]|nr:CBS domain-containing protein [Spirochaetia bacterium]MCF7952562.1 CBS domain-containing protein [Spirochaetales bacterium]